MAAGGLTMGVIRSMTRGAPVRGPSEGDVPRADVALLDKMELLRLAVQYPPENVEGFIQGLRDGQGASDPFQWLKDQYDRAPSDEI